MTIHSSNEILGPTTVVDQFPAEATTADELEERRGLLFCSFFFAWGE